MFRTASKLLLGQPKTASGWVTGAVVAATNAEAGGQTFLTDFTRRASQLKSRLRGKGQYAFAREEAQRFLDAEVPKAELGSWMDAGANATALAQLLLFFEIQPEASVASLLLNKLIRQAEDTSAETTSRLAAADCLLRFRPEENYERVFHVVAQALQQLRKAPSPPPPSTAAPGSADPSALLKTWDAIGLCAKQLQRCGKRVPPSMNEELAQVVMLQLQATPQDSIAYIQHALLRLYSWMVRVERPEANQVLYVLMERAGSFPATRFTPFVLSCARHNQFAPLPVELVERLVRAAFDYRYSCNARDAAAMLGSLAKVMHTLAPNVNGVSLSSLYRVQDYYGALLEELHARVVRFMDRGDPVYWSSAVDVSAIVFAYELGGHVRYRRVFEAYGAYVQHSVEAFEPPQLALATGILRRAQLLTPQLAARLSERIEVVLGELRLAELSHICATFAVLPGPKPSWWEEAKAVALRLQTPDASGVVRLNLAIAFPDEPDLVDTVDYAQIMSKQLVDALPITLGSPRFEEPVVAALCARLTAAGERFAPDDLRMVFASGRPALLQAAQEHLRRVFAEPQWNTDTLFSLPLVCDPHHPEQNQQSFSAAKALAAAKAASVGPEVFVSLADVLLSVFGDGDAAIRHFVQVGGEDLVTQKGYLASTTTVARYLSVVRRYPSVVLPDTWLHNCADGLEAAPRLQPSTMEDFLISLRTLYQDVGKTPALQRLLSCVVEKSYDAMTEVDEQTARITVLLVYLQSGMTLPLLTSQHRLLAKVVHNDAHYAPEVQKALAMMPLPKPAPAEERRGRFVLKHLDKAASSGNAPVFSLDLNTSDPFEIAYDVEAPAAATAQTKATAALEKEEEKMKKATQVEAPKEAPPRTTTTPSPAVSATSPPPVQPEVTINVAAAAAPPPPSSPAPPPAAAAPAEPEKGEKPMSYYAKFFSSSVGQIFAGRGGHHDDTPAPAKEERSSENAAAAAAATAATATAATTGNSGDTAAPAPAPQPRRTRLHPSAVAAAARAAPSTSPPSAPPSASTSATPTAAGAGAAPPPSPAAPFPATPTAVPVTTFTTAWGAPPQAPSLAMTGWNFASSPLQNSSAPNSTAANAATPEQQQQHSNTAFSSLFGSAPAAPTTPPTASAAPSAPPTPSAASPPAPRAAVAGGNNVFFDPSNPSAARSSRPVISRKAVITRQGGFTQGSIGAPVGGDRGSTAATAEEEEIRRIYNDPSRATEVTARAGGNGSGPQIVLDASAVPGAATASFMQKTGVTKITGYNMDGEVTSPTPQAPFPMTAGTSAATASAAGVGEDGTTGEGRPALDWMDAARRVARVTRHPRSKAKSRTHTSLSAWLNTPDARLDADREQSKAAQDAAAAATTAAAAPAKSSGRQTTVAEAVHRGRSKKKDAAAAAAAAEKANAEAEAEAAAAAQAPAHGKRGGRKNAGNSSSGGAGTGRGKGSKAPTAKAAKPAKPAKAAAAPKKKAPAKKAAAAAKTTGGRAKRTPAAAAPKSAVKSARKTVKAAAKKAAPAKKKPAAGKGKKK